MDDGDGDGSDDSATSSRQSLMRGTGTTRTPSVVQPPELSRLAAANVAAPPPPGLQAQVQAQALAAGVSLTSASLEQLQVSCGMPGCNSLPSARAPSVAGSHWDDDGEDPDGTGVSRTERVRAMADLE